MLKNLTELIFGPKKSNEISLANDLTDVIDVARNVLLTKSGFSLGFLRLMPINIDLLSKNEKASICNTLTAELKPETEPFTVYSIPRTVDMEDYINFLVTAHDNEISNGKRKMLLSAMINDASDTVLNGHNFEHQFFIKAWEKTSEKNSRAKIDERLVNMGRSFGAIQNETKRLDDIEILKLCNLYGNSNIAPFEAYDSNIHYTPFPVISDAEEVR